MTLLTTSNPKTAKGEPLGYRTAILHLLPHKLSGRNFCAYATDGCSAVCLNTAGRGQIPEIQDARARRSRLFIEHKDAFLTLLDDEIKRHIKAAKKKGLGPCVRLNGLSDLPWENIKPSVFDAFPDLQFYDYTKYPLRLRQRAIELPNYALTFSVSEKPESEREAVNYLRAGGNAAVVMRAKKDELPSQFTLAGETFPCVNGDLHDLRFLDPPGHIVALSAKGKAAHDTSGFVKDIPKKGQ